MRSYARRSRAVVWSLLVCLLLFGGLLVGFAGAQAVAHSAAATPTPAPVATAAASAAASTAATGGERTPLADVAATLDPPAVWIAFNNLEQVPRASHHEEQATAFLADFGNSLGLETLVDDVGNVIIRKPATPGMEDRQGVVLQAHMDMVAQKTPDSTHDFATDPIDAYVEDGWVHADGTTLGADDGIGVATIMAILQDEEIEHGPLEALFTVNEEDGFTGVNGLSPDVLQGSILINIDSEEEGVFTIGSAGGVDVDITATVTLEPTPADQVAFTVSVAGGQGGHSGMEIADNRANAHVLLARALYGAQQEYGLRLAALSGGNVYNAIPSAATALVAVPADEQDAFLAYIEALQTTVQQEFAAKEPDLTLTAEAADMPDRVMEPAGAARLIAAIYGAHNGVQKMSGSVPGLTETSTNLGILTDTNGVVVMGHLVRSAVDSERDDLAGMLRAIYELAGAEVTFGEPYSGWTPNPDSPIVVLMQQVYADLYDKPAALTALHAGLETSVIGAKYPAMDMISIGPNLFDVHTPNERLEIASVPKIYDLVVATLAQIPAQ